MRVAGDAADYSCAYGVGFFHFFGGEEKEVEVVGGFICFTQLNTGLSKSINFQYKGTFQVTKKTYEP